jgi:hypothetical protein
VQFGQLPPPRHLEYDVTSMGDDLGAAARDWVSERTDYPRHVAQLALAHEADGGVVNVDFDWRPKNNVSNYASAEGTAMSDESFSQIGLLLRYAFFPEILRACCHRERSCSMFILEPLDLERKFLGFSKSVSLVCSSPWLLESSL